MISEYLKKQNSATIRFMRFFLSLCAKIIGLYAILLIAWLINAPNTFFIFIGIHFLITAIMLIKEGEVMSHVVKGTKIALVSSLNFALYMCCLSIINSTINAGNIFYYCFGISLILTLIRLFYSQGLLKKSLDLIKRYKESEKLVKEGNVNKAILAYPRDKGASAKLGRKIFFVFSLPMIFSAVVLYWFYIKTLITIEPGFFVIASIIISLIIESIFEFFSRSTRKILIEKQIDDGNK